MTESTDSKLIGPVFAKIPKILAIHPNGDVFNFFDPTILDKIPP